MSWTRKQALLDWPCTVQEAVVAPEPQAAGPAMSAELCRRAAEEETLRLYPADHWLVVAGLRQEGLLVWEGLPVQEWRRYSSHSEFLYGVVWSHQACRQGNFLAGNGFLF